MKALSVLGAVIIAAAIALVIVLAYRQTALPVETTLTTAKPTTAPTTTSTTAPTASPTDNPVTAPPDTKEDILLLVNYQYEIPDDYEPDLVDGEYELRSGDPDYTGRLVVIGAEVKEAEVEKLFGLA